MINYVLQHNIGEYIYAFLFMWVDRGVFVTRICLFFIFDSEWIVEWSLIVSIELKRWLTLKVKYMIKYFLSLAIVRSQCEVHTY